VKRSRRVFRAVVIVAVGLALIAGVLYFQASRDPADYDPPELTQEQRNLHATRFVQEMTPIINKGEETGPTDSITRTFTEERLNAYLASIDEIAFLRVGSRRGEVREAMAKAGLEGMAIAVNDGGVTLMVRSVEYDKVLSADLSLAMTEAESIKVQLTGARVGRLAIPTGLVRTGLTQLKDALPQRAESGRSRIGGLKVNELEHALTGILAAVDGESIQPQWRVEGVRMSLTGLLAEPGKLTLTFRRSVGRNGSDGE
jgi:hypothetical protein